MAEVKTINVVTKQQPLWQVAVRPIIPWGYLILTEGASHLWFGGSWVIDVLIVFVGAALLFGKAATVMGASVTMTTAEIRLWVAAGTPMDVKAWKESRKLSSVA